MSILQMDLFLKLLLMFFLALHHVRFFMVPLFCFPSCHSFLSLSLPPLSLRAAVTSYERTGSCCVWATQAALELKPPDSQALGCRERMSLHIGLPCALHKRKHTQQTNTVCDVKTHTCSQTEQAKQIPIYTHDHTRLFLDGMQTHMQQDNELDGGE